jgi:hypothetical protein
MYTQSTKYTHTDQQLKGRTWGMPAVGVVHRPSQPQQPQQLGTQRTGRLLYRNNARIPAASNKKGLAWLRERGEAVVVGGGGEPTGGCAFWGSHPEGLTDFLTERRPHTASSGQRRPVGVGRLRVEGLHAQGLQGYIDQNFKNSPMSNRGMHWDVRVGAQTAQTARVRAQTARRASDRSFDVRDPKLYLPLEQQVLI